MRYCRVVIWEWGIRCNDGCQDEETWRGRTIRVGWQVRGKIQCAVLLQSCVTCRSPWEKFAMYISYRDVPFERRNG